MPTRATYQKIKKRIAKLEAEHGATFSELYRRWHDEDCMTAAEIAEEKLGITAGYFKVVRRALGIERVTRHEPIYISGADIHWSLEAKARKLGFANLSDFNYHYYLLGKTIAERCAIIGCGTDSLRRALRKSGVEELPPIITEKRRAAGRENAKKMNATRNDDHIWRKGYK